MKKDSILLSFLVALVIAATAAFFVFTQDEEGDDFVPGPDIEEMEKDDRALPRIPKVPANFFDPKKSASSDAPAAKVVADATVDVEAAAVIGGRVSDPDGKAVEGAVVALCVDVGNTRSMSVLGKVRVYAVTDRSGRYRIEGISVDDRYALRAEGAQFACKVVQCMSLASGEVRRLDIQLSHGFQMKGLVTNVEGAPIAGAEISVFDQLTRASDPKLDIEKVSVSDDNGEFVCVGLNPGMKRVTCQLNGYATQTKLGIQLFKAEKHKAVEFKLVSGGVAFQGTVVDEDDELPVTNVLVSIQPIHTGRRNVPNWNYPPVKTDDDGNFSFVGLMPGPYRFRVFGGKGYPLAGTQVTAQVPQQDGMTVRLRREPSASGIVIDEDTGEPVKKFRVVFGRNEFNIMNAPQMTQSFQDEEGKFEYQGIQTRGAKQFYLHAIAKGFAGGHSEKVTINGKNDISGVIIEMYRGATVKGKVIDSSAEPVRRAQVVMQPQVGAPGESNTPFGSIITRGMRTTRRSTYTDDEGNFTFSNVAEGWYKVDASHQHYSSSVSENSTQVGRSGDYAFETVTLLKGATVKGRVLTSGGNPEKNAAVRLASKGGFATLNQYTRKTDTGGNFEFRKVTPGIYTVKVIERGGKPSANIFEDVVNPPASIIIGDGEIMDLGDI